MATKFSRPISCLVMVVSIFFFPWWYSLALLVAAIFYFTRYYEALFFGLLMDLVYAAEVTEFRGIVLVSFSAAAILFFLIEFLKRRLVFYR